MSATIISLTPRDGEGDAPDHITRRHANPDCDMAVELRRARIRIAQLEASLHEITRENVANYHRARLAEREIKLLSKKSVRATREPSPA